MFMDFFETIYGMTPSQIFTLYLMQTTLKCLNIGTPKTINFPFVPNVKLMILVVPVFEHIIIRLYCAQILGHLI